MTPSSSIFVVADFAKAERPRGPPCMSSAMAVQNLTHDLRRGLPKKGGEACFALATEWRLRPGLWPDLPESTPVGVLSAQLSRSRSRPAMSGSRRYRRGRFAQIADIPQRA